MAKYKVLVDFADLEDENHVYRAGDKYPRKGRAKKERIEELESNSNRLGRPLIEEVGDEE